MCAWMVGAERIIAVCPCKHAAVWDCFLEQLTALKIPAKACVHVYSSFETVVENLFDEATYDDKGDRPTGERAGPMNKSGRHKSGRFCRLFTGTGRRASRNQAILHVGELATDSSMSLLKGACASVLEFVRLGSVAEPSPTIDERRATSEKRRGLDQDETAVLD